MNQLVNVGPDGQIRMNQEALKRAQAEQKVKCARYLRCLGALAPPRRAEVRLFRPRHRAAPGEHRGVVDLCHAEATMARLNDAKRQVEGSWRHL